MEAILHRAPVPFGWRVRTSGLHVLAPNVSPHPDGWLMNPLGQAKEWLDKLLEFFASGKFTYLQNHYLDAALGATSFAGAATVYVALYSTTPGAGGSGGTELSGNAYARVAVTNNATNWPAASSGSKSNGTAITFPTVTTASWTVNGAGILDAATLGNGYYWGDINSKPQTIGVGSTAQFAANNLTCTET